MGDDARDTRAAEDQIQALSDWFYNWELRGRGWHAWHYAVDIEPPFRPLSLPVATSPVPEHSVVIAAGALVRGSMPGVRGPDLTRLSGWEEPWANPAETGVVWRHLTLPANSKLEVLGDSPPLSLQALARLQHLLVVEAVAGGAQLRASVAVSEEDARAIELHLRMAGQRAPPRGDDLAHALRNAPRAAGLVELGLAREFLIPLPAVGSSDAHPWNRACAAMMRLASDECVVLQILLKPAREAWAREMLRAALGPSDTGLFEEDMVAPCREKIATPLFAVAVRVAGFADTQGRADRLALDVAHALGGPETDAANSLIALTDGGLGREAIARNLLERTSLRSGMILGASELARLVPLSGVQDDANRSDSKKRILAQSMMAHDGVQLGEDLNSPVRAQVRVSSSDRLRHMRIIGDAGRSRTNLLARLILDDLDDRKGVALIDCDGTLVDLILRRLPRHRLADATLIDPTRMPVPIDLLNAGAAIERSVLEGDLIAVLSRLDVGWGAQCSTILVDAIATLRDQDGVPTILDVRRVLAGRRVSETLSSFAEVIVGALDRLLERDAVRHVVAGTGHPFDFNRLLGGGTLLARLSSEPIGRMRSDTLAGLVLAKLHQAFIVSAASPDYERPTFFLYVNAVEPAVAQWATGLSSIARKCGLGLVIAYPAGATSEAEVQSAQPNPFHVSITCRAELHSARVQIGRAEFTVEIADLPVEPSDAGQRARDILSVTARRYGLADQMFVTPDLAAAFPKIPRIKMTRSNSRRA